MNSRRNISLYTVNCVLLANLSFVVKDCNSKQIETKAPSSRSRSDCAQECDGQEVTGMLKDAVRHVLVVYLLAV